MADDKTQTWDDLYETPPAAPTDTDPDPSPEPTPEPELKPLSPEPEEDIIPTANSSEELEAMGQQPRDLNANEPDPEPIDKPGDAEPKDPADPADSNADVEMSGVEQYLSQFDIEGGMISFEDGSSTHFTELESDKQMEILNQLHGSQAATVEAKYGLDDNEIGLINYLRENKLTVEDMIENMAEDRVKVLGAMKEVETLNYKEMSDEAVYLQFLKKSNPEASAEQLEGDLEKAKQQTGFDKVATSLRTQLESQQNRVIQDKLQNDNATQQEILENQRKQVVDAVIGIKDIAGIDLNDGIKNGILDKVLEVNEFGDSRFMEEVFGEPTKLFNAAFWYYYGTDLMAQRDNYWKQEKSKAYKRGRNDALGTDSTKISFGSGDKPVADGDKPQPAKSNDDDWLSLHQ